MNAHTPIAVANVGNVQAFRVLKNTCASVLVDVGATVYAGSDYYGCASDDSRATGIEHSAFSLNPSGVPFFTIPRRDVVAIAKAQGGAA